MLSSGNKVILFEAFSLFMEETSTGKIHSQAIATLPPLPIDVPSILDSFRPRPNVEQALKDQLLNKNTTMVVAQGMGGVGKSVIASSLLHNQEIRERFVDGVAWVGMSQAPQILALQQRCFLQLTKDHMPSNRRNSIKEQHACLSEALVSKTHLIVLDDCWDKAHAKCFDVIDAATSSKLLISTRYVREFTHAA
jgi:hypothetical protein